MMADDSTNGWETWGRHVLEELRRFNKNMSNLTDEVHEIAKGMIAVERDIEQHGRDLERHSADRKRMEAQLQKIDNRCDGCEVRLAGMKALTPWRRRSEAAGYATGGGALVALANWLFSKWGV